MLKGNIFNIHFNSKKIISIILLILLLANTFIIFTSNDVQATHSAEFKNYPKYEELIKALEKAHPNWEFEILKTGLDWSEAIIAESTGGHGKNVVSKNSSSSWVCGCTTKTDPDWTCASTAAVAYYMDPRNSLNEEYIFQFEQLTYDKINQTKEGVELILSPCKYLQGKITYYDSNGKKQTLNKTYVDVIMEAAQTYNISPYHLAARIRQEQGTGNGTSLISGTWTGENGAYKGLYNFFNVKAYGSTDNAIIKNGLTWAKKQGWTDPEKAIKGGASVIANDYISNGQDTLYLQKFDVVAEGGYYSWQYMTNVSASKTEGKSIRSAYEDMNLINEKTKLKFKIPVYENMSAELSAKPGDEKPVTQDVKLTGDSVAVRSGKGTNYSKITSLNKGAIVLRIELDNAKDQAGIYWDKVVLSDGKKGYISRQYLSEIAIQKPLDEKYVVSKYTNFRNGPGTKGTTVLKLLSPGQMITVVEKDKYKSVDGEAWYRVKLANGTYGYVGAAYIEVYDPNKTYLEPVQVVCEGGLNIRKEPSTSSTVLKAVAEGVTLTRTEQNVKSTDTKYIWDKVTLSNGTVGYVVRQDPDTKELWIKPIDLNDDNQNNGDSDNNNNNNNETPSNSILKGNGFIEKDSYIIFNPKITPATLKKVASDAVIKNGNTNIKDTEHIGTGYVITANKKTFKAVVLGDVNGDGKIGSADYVRIKNHLLKKVTLTEEQKKAANANNDDKVSSADYVRVKNYLLNKASITI